MIVLKEHKGFPYWGFEPLAAEKARCLTLPAEKRREYEREAHRQEELIRAHGFEPERLGIREKATAVTLAQEIEDKTGVQMLVFVHGKE